MPDLRTDDGPRKLRAVWLGPNGATFPFQWTYVQWAVTLLAVPATIAVFWLVLTAIGLEQFTVGAIAVPWGGALAIFLVVKAMARVSFDRPLRYHRHLLAHEWRDGQVPITEEQRVEFTPPAVGYLSPRILKTMDWLTSEQFPVMTSDRNDTTDDASDDRSDKEDPDDQEEGEAGIERSAD